MRIRCAAISVICLSFPVSMFALCFEPARPCTWYAAHHGQPTFIGTAVSQELVPDVLRIGNHEMAVTVQKAVFNVEETLDGAPAKTETVYGEGTTNDFHFNVGEKYLVYGWREKEGKIRTARCTRTSLLSQADEDLQFLRSLRTRHGGEIFGTVSFLNPESQAGSLAGTIIESGRSGEHKSRVPDSGIYEVTGLAPGEYRETFILDGSKTELVKLKVSIPVNGSCAESGFRVGDIPVTGRVVGATGTAISGAIVTLFYALDGRFHPDVLLRTHTDKSGTFVFPHVEPAKFILAAQPPDSAMIFYPSTREPSKTDAIQIEHSTPPPALIIHIRNP